VRRLAAIGFLAIVLFNIYGYRLLINYVQDRQDRQLETRIDNDSYAEQDLVYIKIPVKLPYYNNSKQFEKVSGAIEYNGVEYKYVKRRVYNDTIELACMLNTGKQKFQSARDEFVKLSSDWQNSHQGKKSNTGSIKNLPLDFCNKLIAYSFHKPDEGQSRTFISFSSPVQSRLHTVLEQPPDAA
jgi:hypothetical protein